MNEGIALTAKARELAGKIDKATPGPWEFASAQIEPYPPTKEALLRFIEESWNDSVGEGWGVLRSVSAEKVICVFGNGPSTQANSNSLEAARNEAPDLLREAADEIERLRRVVDQATKWLRITHDGVIFASDEVAARSEEVPDLAQELKEAQ